MRIPQVPPHPVMILALVMSIMVNAGAAPNEIGYIESFALAKDREAALAQLIPGTEAYYYYYCLYHQAQGDLSAVEKLLTPWIKRHGKSGLYNEIRNRQSLLAYAENPKGSLDYLVKQLGLRFDHQKQELNRKPALPTALDPKQVTGGAFLQRAFSTHKNLDDVEERGLDGLLRGQVKLDPVRRRHLLQRLIRPDFQGLVALVDADLKSEESRGFGEFNIHRALLPAQLEQLVKLRPELISNRNYVHAVVSKLRPNADIDWQNDPVEKSAYLARVWDFVKGLHPVFNTLKAHSLYQVLADQREAGQYDRSLFLEYLKLPRRVGYVEPRYLNDPDRRRVIAELGTDFSKVTACQTIGNDEPLVRDFFMHLFVDDAGWNIYADYVRESWLKPVFAEAKILAGIGDQEKWYSLLSPAAYEALKERVDLQFVRHNPRTFAAGAPVSIGIEIKNVRQLIVKVYEINALNYYLQEGLEVNTDLELDGLVANSEKSYTYDEPPLRRILRKFDFPELANKRGVWVVELIGNGRSSRALIRKGGLQYLARTTPAGTAFNILNIDNKPVDAPSVWIAGRQFKPGKQGNIIVPYSTKPGHQPVILADGDFAALEFHAMPAEDYKLSAGFHVEAETLLPGHMTSIAVRPALTLNGAPTTLGLLGDTVLTITSTDHEGITSTLEMPSFQLAEDRESTCNFRVPERLNRLQVTLRGSVENISTGEGQQVSASASFEVNGIDQTEHVWLPHLAKIGDNYVLELLGKNGEPFTDLPIRLSFKHRDYKASHQVTLKSAPNGQVQLGPLPGIVRIATDSVPGGQRNWQLGGDFVHLPGSLHGITGSDMSIPYAGAALRVSPADFALLEVRNGTFASDHLQALSLGGGFVRIKGLRAGDYQLVLKEQGKTLALRITAGEVAHGYALGGSRHLEIKRGSNLQIIEIDPGEKKTRIQLAGAGPFTRVHLVAGRYLPAFSLRDYIGAFPYAEPYLVARSTSTSRYLSGRDIGDEYRYIIERRGAQKFPGNMLSRPGLILNPWAIRDTDTGTDNAKDGQEWQSSAEDKKGRRAPNAKAQSASSRGRGILGGAAARGTISASLDFLAEGASVLYNLVPDKNGVVSIDTGDLGDRQFLHILAVDPQNTVYRQLALPERGTRVRDLRLATGLDPKGHFSEQKQTSVLQKGESLEIKDVRTAKVETYEELSKVYTCLTALNGDPTLAEFRFLVDWPTLKLEEKRAKYSKYACHELHFFLSRRDPVFFGEVVKPYLVAKRNKTFMDHYLLGEELGSYLRPWQYGRLNVVERILLAGALGGGEPANTASHLGDIMDLQPRDIGRESIVYATAVKGLALSAEVGFFSAALEAAQEEMHDVDANKQKETDLRRLGDSAAAKIPDPASVPAAGFGGGGMLSKNLSSRLSEKYKATRRSSEQLRKLEGEGKDKVNAFYSRDAVGDGLADGRFSYFGEVSEMTKRTQARRLFRQLEKTREYAENNYYHRRITDQGASLITANSFWKDYANHTARAAGKPFLSSNFGHASRNFTEAVFALTVIDLPFAADQPEAVAGAAKGKDALSVTITASGPTIAFHREIKAAPISDERSPLLVAQNYFRLSERYETRGGERYDRFVRDEFLTGVVYGTQIAVTNPTSARQKLDVLTQVPAGALPCSRSKYTAGQHLSIEPYATRTLDLHFYFPVPSGEKPFGVFPAHAAKNEAIVAWAEGLDFTVVRQATRIDTGSWDYISQHAGAKAVLEFLQQNNPRAVDLGRIAWRMRDADFFKATLDLLEKRHVYHGALYSYALHHNAVVPARQFLAHQDGFLHSCGLYLESELATINPVERHFYEHLEYAPLVNARAHSLGKGRKILNNAFRGQYQAFLKILSYKQNLDAEDRLALSYYLFLQDRIDESLQWLGSIDRSAIAEKLQYDYLNCYAAFYTGKPEAASRIAAGYAEHPVARWRGRFTEIIAQAEEISGVTGVVDLKPGEDAENQREKEHELIAAGEPTVDLKVEGGEVKVSYRNVADAVVNYYTMDLEFLFSTKPFLSGESGRFSIIKPNHTARLKLPKGKDTYTFSLPKEFSGQNVLVEIVAGSSSAAQPYFANTLKVTVVENYGRLEVRETKSGKPVSRAYIKVYARNVAGRPVFYKDGYTDLRGKFDYTSLSTDALDGTSRFALLVMSEDHGALVKEVAPPVR
jgi:hypothetical protein